MQWSRSGRVMITARDVKWLSPQRMQRARGSSISDTSNYCFKKSHTKLSSFLTGSNIMSRMSAIMKNQ